MRAKELTLLRRRLGNLAELNRDNLPLAFFEPVTPKEAMEHEAAKMLEPLRMQAAMDFGLFRGGEAPNQLSMF
jgi:hypothetical protein